MESFWRYHGVKCILQPAPGGSSPVAAGEPVPEPDFDGRWGLPCPPPGQCSGAPRRRCAAKGTIASYCVPHRRISFAWARDTPPVDLAPVTPPPWRPSLCAQAGGGKFRAVPCATHLTRLAAGRRRTRTAWGPGTGAGAPLTGPCRVPNRPTVTRRLTLRPLIQLRPLRPVGGRSSHRGPGFGVRRG